MVNPLGIIYWSWIIYLRMMSTTTVLTFKQGRSLNNHNRDDACMDRLCSSRIIHSMAISLTADSSNSVSQSVVMSCMLWIALVASLLTQCLGDGNRVRRAPCSSPDKRCFSTLSVAANVTTNANINAGGYLIDVFCAETKCPPSSFCFMGGCPCRPGYASSSSSTICDTRLPQKQANRWYTSSCPNLESTSGRTFDVDEKLESTGGENGPSSCPPHLRSCAYLCYSHDSYDSSIT